MRGKLKLVEHVEQEEKVLKEAEDKKRQEEEEQKKRHEKIKKSAEIRRESRPQHLEELLKMDLDTASIKDMKAIMIKMGISFYDCLERGDLKKKLLERVPELRIATERKGSISSRGSASGKIMLFIQLYPHPSGLNKAPWGTGADASIGMIESSCMLASIPGLTFSCCCLCHCSSHP